MLGGGFAGLSAAIHLSIAGHEVTLLEAADTLGGKAGTFAEAGFSFDTGPSVFTLPHVLEAVFAAAGEACPLTFTPLAPLCRYRFPSGRVWDVYRDVERTVAGLSSREARTYRTLLEEARALYEAAAPTFVYGPAPTPAELFRYGLRHGLRTQPLRTLPQLLGRHGAEGDLKQFFLRFATYFGADPYRAPAVLHNIAWVELGLGVYGLEGGVRAVVQALEELAVRLGVEVRMGTRVERLETAGGEVSTVHTDRSTFSADAVVSSLDPVRTHRLMGKGTRLERLEPSLSGFVLLLGIERKTSELAHHTVLFANDYRGEFAAIQRGEPPQDPTLYLSVGSNGPGGAPPGCESWFVMANAPALPATGGSFWAEREAPYAEHILETLERRGLTVRSRIRVQRILTPEHLARFAHRGSIYGAAPHSLLSTLRPKQTVRGVKNLFLAGGSVYPGGGIPLSLLSGKGAAELVASMRDRGDAQAAAKR